MNNKSVLHLLLKLNILKIPPAAWDFIFPHGHKVSQQLVEYMAAGVVRDIASEIENREIQKSLMNTGKEMAEYSSRGLIQGWEDGDDICPPWPFPGPGPWPWLIRANDPIPEPYRFGSIKQLVLADLLASLAEVTTNGDFSVQLHKTAISLAEEASSNIVPDFKKANISPRTVNK